MRHPTGRSLAAALATRFAASLASAGVTCPATHRLAVAFSGGADSTATGLLAAWWAGTARPPASVAAALAAHRRRTDTAADVPRRRREPTLADAARAALGMPQAPSLITPYQARPFSRAPAAVIVDHGLRGAASSRDAGAAAVLARRLGLEPVVVRAAWRGEDDSTSSSPLPARPLPGTPASAPARAARYAALTAAAQATGSSALLTGHSSDDQAETVLLRLGRASGVDGLGGMREVSALGGALPLIRPVLAATKAELLRLLRRTGLEACVVLDPTNAAPAAGGRNAVRAVLGGAPAAAAGGGGGGGWDRPTHTASRDARALARLCGTARDLGEAEAVALLAEAGAVGDGSLAVAPFSAAPPPVARRALAALLAAASGSPYPPSSAVVDRLLTVVATGLLQGGVSGGRCVVRPVAGSKGRRMEVVKE